MSKLAHSNQETMDQIEAAEQTNQISMFASDPPIDPTADALEKAAKIADKYAPSGSKDMVATIARSIAADIRSLKTIMAHDTAQDI